MNQSVLDEFKLSDLLAITPLLTLVLTILILLFCPQFYQNRHMPPPAMFKCVYMYFVYSSVADIILLYMYIIIGYHQERQEYNNL